MKAVLFRACPYSIRARAPRESPPYNGFFIGLIPPLLRYMKNNT